MATIILIENDYAIRQSLTEILQIQGHNVLAMSNAENLLNEIQEYNPHILITNIIMPEKDGIEVIMEMKKIHPNTRIIAVSGGGRIDSESYLNAARVLGADATLKKPFTHDQLFDIINNLGIKA